MDNNVDNSNIVSEEIVPQEAKGFGVYLDGYFLCAVTDKTIAQISFDEVLNNRISSLTFDGTAEHSFSNNIEYKEGIYSNETFVNQTEFLQLVNASVVDYTKEPLPVKLSVSTVVTTVKDVVLEYETKTVYTDALVNGAIKTLSDGYNGEGIETKKVSFVDGVQVNAVSSVEVVKAAIDEVIHVGTRAGSYTVAASIDFEWPYDGFIYSYYGESDGRVQTHKGLDLVNYGGCFRDPAYAAADGVVLFSGNKGNGYGNYVIIDHGNGVQTFYAHFDSCSVSTGDVVKAGDEVGKIGSTGRSTGPHLHFEIKIDGVSVDPLIFLD